MSAVHLTAFCSPSVPRMKKLWRSNVGRVEILIIRRIAISGSLILHSAGVISVGQQRVPAEPLEIRLSPACRCDRSALRRPAGCRSPRPASYPPRGCRAARHAGPRCPPRPRADRGKLRAVGMSKAGRTTTLIGVPGLVHPVASVTRRATASTASPQNLHPACVSARPDVVIGQSADVT